MATVKLAKALPRSIQHGVDRFSRRSYSYYQRAEYAIEVDGVKVGRVYWRYGFWYVSWPADPADTGGEPRYWVNDFGRRMQLPAVRYWVKENAERIAKRGKPDSPQAYLAYVGGHAPARS
jgi:hypothetical protein